MPQPTDAVWRSYERSLRLSNRAASTIETYSKTYRQLAGFTGTLPTECSKADIEEFILARQQRCAQTTVSQDALNLKIFFKWAVTEELIPRSPMDRIPIPKPEHVDKRVLTDAELKQILKVTTGPTFSQRRDHAILRVLCEIGSPRASELCDMTVDSIDLSHDLVTLVGKTGMRTIPVSAKTMRAIELYSRIREKHYAAAGTESFWLGLKGQLGRRGLHSMVKTRAVQSGILNPEQISPHTFRHTAASRASEAGIADSLLEPLFGWVDNSPMTRHYGRATRKRRAQDAARAVGLGDRL